MEKQMKKERPAIKWMKVVVQLKIAKLLLGRYNKVSIAILYIGHYVGLSVDSVNPLQSLLLYDDAI